MAIIDHEDPPIQDQPVTGEPVQDQPVSGKPIQNQPVSGEPVQDQPATGEPVQDQLVLGELPPPNSQSMVPNLNITTMEVDLILNELTGRNSLPPRLLAPSIRLTPIDEAAGKDRIFAMAFPTLYPTGQADFNAPRVRKVDLNDYARHLMCFLDGRFGRHPRWRFLVFNMLMRRKVGSSAHNLTISICLYTKRQAVRPAFTFLKPPVLRILAGMSLWKRYLRTRLYYLKSSVRVLL
jgi:hypothetical protein